jgi:rhodanese-related sulfurtransferase
MSQSFIKMSWIIIVLALSGTIARGADFKDLTAQELKGMLDRGDKIMVINPLSDIEFEDGYIPGSVNIPLHLIPSTNLLPQDKSTPVVTYCLGPE